MQYKTIVLELLEQRKELHEQLRVTRRLLPTLNSCAAELKGRHLAWKQALAKENPDLEPGQIASRALELAIRELEDRLSDVFPPEETEPLSLDQAMAFVARHTPKE